MFSGSYSRRRPVEDCDEDEDTVRSLPPSQLIQDDEDEDEDIFQSSETEVFTPTEQGDRNLEPPSNDERQLGVKGSDWIKQLDSGCAEDHDEKGLLLQGNRVAATAAESRPLSSTKKRKRKSFGLAEKLLKLLKQHESDEALRQHIRIHGSTTESEKEGAAVRPRSTENSADAAATDLVDLELNIVDITPFRNDLLWRVARCLEVEDSQSEFDVLLQTSLLGSMVEQMDTGMEIKIQAPYFVNTSSSTSSSQADDHVVPMLFGVTHLEIQDQPILPSFSKLRKSKLLIHWTCDCEEENPV